MVSSVGRRPVRHPRVVVQVLEEGAWLGDPSCNRWYSLNATALALWEQCDGCTTVEEMVRAVCDLFAVDCEVAALQVQAVLAELTQRALVEWLDHHRGAPC